MVQCMENVLYAGENEVVGRCDWHGRLGWEPSHRVANPSCSGFPHPDGITPIGVECRPCVPTIFAVWGPRGAFAWFNVNQDANSGRGQWCAITIEMAVKLGVGGELGVDSRASQKIQGELGLG